MKSQLSDSNSCDLFGSCICSVWLVAPNLRRKQSPDSHLVGCMSTFSSADVSNCYSYWQYFYSSTLACLSKRLTLSVKFSTFYVDDLFACMNKGDRAYSGLSSFLASVLVSCCSWMVSLRYPNTIVAC